jgi:hypothetical protein
VPLLVCLPYLPPVQFFAWWLAHPGPVQLEAHEHLPKQTYRNRCYIKAAHKVERLSVPLLHPTGHLPAGLVEISYRERWADVHWRGLASAYGKAPYFAHLGGAVHDELYRRPARLWDLNLALLSVCLAGLRLNPHFVITEGYQAAPDPAILDHRHALAPPNGLPAGAPAYHQLFGNEFVNNLSILDLLFGQGPSAQAYLSQLNLFLSQKA